MPLKLRLQRHGKKGKPFYWLVAADSRAKRDGRYLEKIGTYNPNTNPATVIIDIDRAVEWLEKGAQPTDTARTLLSYKGAMLKHHLNGGVRKGALTQEIADKKFADWLKEKDAKIQAKKDNLLKANEEDKIKRLAAEKQASEKRLEDAAAKEASANQDVSSSDKAPVAEETPTTDEAPAADEAPTTDEASAADEAPTTDEASAAEETPTTDEAPAAEETPTTDEAPATEETPTTDEAPAAEEASDKDDKTAKGENNSKNTD